MSNAIEKRRPHVIIVGAGFGGLTAAQSLAHAPVDVTVIDRTNHHLFQPLLYQVATAGLSPAEIAAPIRSVVSGQVNTDVVLDEILKVDLAAKTLTAREEGTLSYDYLILAVGARNNYFGHDEWEKYAPGLKSLDEAVEIRRRVLLAFESAEREKNPEERARLLTFSVIGGGATGVEMAGAIAELSRFALARDFRSINPASTKVVLIEAGPRILAAFPEDLSKSALRQLEGLGVEVKTGVRVKAIDARGVYFEQGEILCATVVWGAGVKAAALGATLGVPIDRGGRVLVEKDYSVPGHTEVFAIGDMAFIKDVKGVEVPGLSAAAMQAARFVAKSIQHDLQGKPRESFQYFDKGTMATIGRSRAIALAQGIKLTGFIAWLAWLLVHVWYLIGFRNRAVVMLNWIWSYLTYKRGARLITGDRLEAGPPHSLPAPEPVVATSPVGAHDLPAPPAS